MKLATIETPYSSLNDLLYPDNGFKRGKLVTISGIVDIFPKNILRDLYTNYELHNIPHILRSNMKPIVVDIAFDLNNENLIKRYKAIGVKPITNGLRQKNIKYSNKLEEIFHYVTSLEDEGYEVQQITIDDLSSDGIRNELGELLGIADIHILFRRFFEPRNILVFTNTTMDAQVRFLKRDYPLEYLEKTAQIKSFTGFNNACHADCEILVDYKAGVQIPTLLMYINKHRGLSIKKPYAEIVATAENSNLFDVTDS